MKSFTCALVLLAVTATISQNLSAGELGGCAGDHGGYAGKHGGFGDKGIGSFVPGPVGPMPAGPNPALFALVAQQRQALAAQAAAYRAARRPLKLAKAYEMRQATLAARESRKAWVLAKQEERLRAAEPQDIAPPSANSGPTYFAMHAEAGGR